MDSRKKTWEAPTVEALGVEQTLGGSVKQATESFFRDGSINLTGGSVFPENYKR